MGNFTGVVPLDYLGTNSYRYKPNAADPLTYTANDGAVYCADQEMDTDLASTPRVLWVLPGYSPDSFAKSALLHDHFFEMHHRGQDIVGFSKANALLEEMVRTEGASRWLAWTYRVACNLGGKSIWDRQRVGAVVSPHPQTANIYILTAIQEWMTEGDWGAIDRRLQAMDFTGMDDASIHTWFSMLNHPDIRAKLPSLVTARQRCAAHLAATRSSDDWDGAKIFEVMYG